MIQAHAQAVLDLLDADNTAPALVVHDGAVPSGATPPYVVVYFTIVTPTAGQAPDSADINFDSRRLIVDAYCHSIGGTARAARIVAGRVRAALLNVRPTVTGRSAFPIRQQEGQPPQRDETTGVLVFDQIDVYRLQTVPG